MNAAKRPTRSSSTSPATASSSPPSSTTTTAATAATAAELSAQRIVKLLDAVWPLRFAEPGDAVGLVVGRREAAVRSVLLAVDCTPAVVVEALDQRQPMILSVFPPFTAALDTVTDRTPAGRLVLDLARHDLALAVGHTAWMAAPGGIDEIVLATLKCRKLRPLKPSLKPMWAKLVVTLRTADLPELLAVVGKTGVPESAIAITPITSPPGSAANLDSEPEIVPEIIDDADPDATDDDADGHAAIAELPATGEIGAAEADWSALGRACRVELTVLDEQRKTVMTAIGAMVDGGTAAVTLDHYELANTDKQAGLGRVGELAQRIPIKRFIGEIRRLLKPPQMRTVGNVDGKVKRVAVAFAADTEAIAQAVNYGANVLLAGDLDFASARLAAELGLVVLDVGVVSLVQFALPTLRDRIASALPGVSVETASLIADPFFA